MKLYIFFIAIIFSFLSCKNDNDLNNQSWGTATIFKNGKNWNNKITAHPNGPPSSIGIDVIFRNNDNGEFLGFFKMPLSIGKHNVISNGTLNPDSLMGATYFVPEGDVLADLYYIAKDDEVEDYIEITEMAGDEIKGRLQVSFLRDTSSPPFRPTSLDTLIFTNGTFHTRVKN